MVNWNIFFLNTLSNLVLGSKSKVMKCTRLVDEEDECRPEWESAQGSRVF